MLEVLVEVDGRPLSRWACDGMLVSTPTGSTAYAFSAGGPVVWPGVDALLVVPLSAHALFARPLVLSPTSTVVVEVLDVSPTHGVVWCDGRRSVELRTGMEIEVTRGRQRLRLARLSAGPLHRSAGPEIRPASRGLARLSRPGHHRDRHACMITELRIADLGVISDAIISLHPGLTVVTGETGAGKTMIVSGLGLLLGGRADPRSVRRGSERARVEGRFRSTTLSWRRLCRRPAVNLMMTSSSLRAPRHLGRALPGLRGRRPSACQRLRGADGRTRPDPRPSRAGAPHRGGSSAAAPGSLCWCPGTRTAGEIHESLGRGSVRRGRSWPNCVPRPSVGLARSIC